MIIASFSYTSIFDLFMPWTQILGTLDLSGSHTVTKSFIVFSKYESYLRQVNSDKIQTIYNKAMFLAKKSFCVIISSNRS